MQDRPCGPCALLGEIDSRGAGFIPRQQEGLPCAVVTTRRAVGRIETGQVADQRVQGRDAPGGTPRFRRIRGTLDQATRDGDRGRYLLTKLPRCQASAKRVARLSRKRWTLETAVQHLEAYFPSAINPLGYPKAALCGLCLALVASNMVAVVMAALRSGHGEATSDHDLSLYAVAPELAQTSQGMMMAIPEDAGRILRRMTPAEMVATRWLLAEKVRLSAYRKSSRGPKKPRPTRQGTPKVSQVSTAKLLREQHARAMVP